MQRRGPSLRRLFSLVAIGALGGGVLAEIVLRADPTLLPETAQLRLHWRGTEGDMLKVPDPRFGYTHGANQTGEVRYRDFGFTYTTNEQGFRDGAPWAAGDIVAIGDSQTFGFGVDDADAWLAVLDRRLEGGHVINLGINGSAPGQHGRTFETFARELRPRTVLFGLFPGHALGAQAEYQAWLDAGQPVSLPAFRAAHSDEPAWRQAIRWAITHSRVLLYLRTVADRLRTPYPGSTLATADGGRIRFAPYIYAAHAEAATPGQPHFETVLDIVAGIHAQVTTEGGRFLVVLFPTKEEVHLPLLGRPAPDVTGPFVSALAERGIPVVDLLPAFREHARAGERLFLEIDIHPNAAGQAMIAEQVLARLRADVSRIASDDRQHPRGFLD